jgi:hypothetical protein
MATEAIEVGSFAGRVTKKGGLFSCSSGGVPPMPEPAILFPDRLYPKEWRVEWIDDGGETEVAIFAGPKARERAIGYADRQYGVFEEVGFDP